MFDPESVKYNVSVMWNITNPLLSEGVGRYFLTLDAVENAQLLSQIAQYAQHAFLHPEVGTMNTVLC